jgi:hypothetical protein
MEKVNGQKIKKILKEVYPKNKFLVRVTRYTYSKGVEIKTDLLKRLPPLEKIQTDADRWEYSKLLEENRKKAWEIYEILERNGIDLEGKGLEISAF